MEQPRVLLVDDEEEFVSTLAERLRLRGMRAETAYNGEAALQMIAATPPDVVVLDVMMPGMNGLAVLQRIKTDNPHLPVILLTGMGTTRDGVEGLRLGALDYLVKPVKIEELIEKLDRALQKTSGGVT